MYLVSSIKNLTWKFELELLLSNQRVVVSRKLYKFSFSPPSSCKTFFKTSERKRAIVVFDIELWIELSGLYILASFI